MSAMAQPLPSSRIDPIMKPPFTSAELRDASHQAMMLALSSWCPQMRKSLLDAAERLIVEAESGEMRKEARHIGTERIPAARAVHGLERSIN